MGVINLILNLAGLLIWLGWRDLAINPLIENSATPLARTLRHAGPDKLIRWKYLGGLAGLLLLRPLIYWWIGPAVNTKPLYLQLVAIAIPFRCDLFGQMVLFSLASFGVTLLFFYLALLLLSLVNRGVSDAEPLQKFVRNHLGRVEHLPFVVKLLLPVLVTTALWLVLSPLLARAEILPHASSAGALVKQGLLISVGTGLVCKYVVATVLLLHFLNSYIYFGNHPLWNFVNATARRLLAPLRWLPLKFGRMDFAPVVGIVVVFLLATVIENGAHTKNHTLFSSLAERYENVSR